MLSSIDIHSSVAVYIQIENHIRFAISAGKLNHGDQLPSVRELSERLGVNPNTVAKAYRDLEVMGLLYTRRGMGVFIGKGVRRNCREECFTGIAKRISEIVKEAEAAGMNGEFHDIVKMAQKHSDKGSLYGETPGPVLAKAKQLAKIPAGK